MIGMSYRRKCLPVCLPGFPGFQCCSYTWSNGHGQHPKPQVRGLTAMSCPAQPSCVAHLPLCNAAVMFAVHQQALRQARQRVGADVASVFYLPDVMCFYIQLEAVCAEEKIHLTKNVSECEYSKYLFASHLPKMFSNKNTLSKSLP